MGLHSYATASNANAQELAGSLSSADVIALAADLKTMGERAWMLWQCDVSNESEIENYVSATPALRAKKVKWRDPVLRSRLVLASIRHCFAGHALLRFLADHECELSVGGPYRDTTASAGSLFWQIWGTEIPEWPEQFESVCPSPFS
jgi:hypothetical protein